MKLYIGSNKKKAKEVTIAQALAYFIRKAGVKAEADGFDDGSGSWISIKERTTDKQNKEFEVDTVINFSGDGSEFEEIQIFLAPIEPNYEKQRKLV